LLIKVFDYSLASMVIDSVLEPVLRTAARPPHCWRRSANAEASKSAQSAMPTIPCLAPNALPQKGTNFAKMPDLEGDRTNDMSEITNIAET